MSRLFVLTFLAACALMTGSCYLGDDVDCRDEDAPFMPLESATYFHQARSRAPSVHQGALLSGSMNVDRSNSRVTVEYETSSGSFVEEYEVVEQTRVNLYY